MMGCGKRKEVRDDARVWPEPLEKQSCYLLLWEDRKGGRPGACMVHAEFEMSTIHPQEERRGSRESSLSGRYT